ncbi:hypothetical protein HUE57_00670 [Candidatus Reidiella endopervernicosa]|uniref:Uncharacterized protein n=1 Tax=Candidatus Reidiella endopervernicosa TaxID=2738883 RepID=A0A6N0I0F0_9GAMM|nr:hypothetical protein HUE57_00670 [Candidatus Reidiella endopervernicosa]
MAKSDIDMVSEYHLNSSLDYLRTLMVKLYKRNPKEWRRGGFESMEAAVARLFANEQGWAVPNVGGKRGTALIEEAFREDYGHDRVLAFIAGLATMSIDAYGGKTEFYMFDSIEPQSLYNAARNYEIAAWRLGHSRNVRGELFLLSNATEGRVINLSYERLFGKLIASHDLMAKIMSDKTNRTIKGVIQRVAGAVFLPI